MYVAVIQKTEKIKLLNEDQKIIHPPNKVTRSTQSSVVLLILLVLFIFLDLWNLWTVGLPIFHPITIY